MTLLLEIEYLSGVSFAAIGPDSDVPEWPPQPDRVFSALVAAWASRGERAEEAEALEWLEGQPPPRIDASGAEARTGRAVFVPPNDYQTPKGELDKLKWYRDFLSRGTSPPEKGGHKKLWLQALNVMPDKRKRAGLKEREFGFPAARPHDATVLLRWDGVKADGGTLAALEQLAGEVAYVGHSASLTRCRFRVEADAVEGRHGAESPRRRVYPGRMAELRREFEAGRRPLPGHPAETAAAPTHERSNVFGEQWLLLEHIGGTMPDIRASALMARTIRDAILSGYRRVGLEAGIPEVVSGHTPEGRPSREPHLAVVPLPFVGFPHADGHVMGFAVVPPHAIAILDDEDFRRALRAVAPLNEDRGRRILTIATREGTPRDRAFSIELSPAFEPPPGRRSLDPRMYVAPARDFATVTPIALDRHLKAKGEARIEEVREQIARACRNVGLPEPEAVVAGKHATLVGAPSAYPSGNAPPWMRWRLPSPLATRQLIHAFLRFPVDVPGPVILGAGRHCGLGLCRAVTSKGKR